MDGAPPTYALAEGLRLDPLLPFSLVCRDDLDNVRNSMA